MKATANADVLTYYAEPGPFTDLSLHAARVRELPEALPELCRIVQGLVVHPFLCHLYGLEPATLRQDELQIRRATAIVDRMLAVDPRPLAEARPSWRCSIALPSLREPGSDTPSCWPCRISSPACGCRG